ncbi:hypothetical protein SAMN05444365_101112 [Micromonospora pattaloongensis]|uniref:Uncharacterized protein n=1 Tax=Micromonospora pattaloongensis TaxID=405436 RepID=A0A1H3FPS8_9ACTN|nr:hypothetical protein [Micromonospora pattaloongensis]SDX92996.1 hypothetical protein SAMN05444365_101112 [Micromonospora pattaloongensis]
MRVVRAIVGMLLLTVGVPTFFVGGALWMAAQHRDAGGAFSGSMQRLERTGSAVVVPDLDALLARDAPFTRDDRTTLRITAQTEAGPSFVGIAPSALVTSYLAGLPHARVDAVGVARGPLPVQLTRVPRGGVEPVPAAEPATQSFWLRQGVGALDLTPAELRGQEVALVIMRPDGRLAAGVELRAEVRPGWLDPTSWGLLALGALAIAAGTAVLAWPTRPREVVIVVEPDQVPALAARLGLQTLNGIGRDATVPAGTALPSPSAPGSAAQTLPSPSAPGSAAQAPPAWPAPSTRPATLADTTDASPSNPSATGSPAVPSGRAGDEVRPGPVRPGPVRPPVTPTLAWPPAPDAVAGTPASDAAPTHNGAAETVATRAVAPATPGRHAAPTAPATATAAAPESGSGTEGRHAAPTHDGDPAAPTEPAAASRNALPLPPATWRGGPRPDAPRTPVREVAAATRQRRANDDAATAEPTPGRRPDSADALAGPTAEARRATLPAGEARAAALAQTPALPVVSHQPPSSATPGLAGTSAAPGAPGLAGTSAAPGTPGLAGTPAAAPAKRRRKTAGGLPAPDVLPIIVPPLNVPPMNVVLPRGGQSRRRNAAKSGTVAKGGESASGNAPRS